MADTLDKRPVSVLGEIVRHIKRNVWSPLWVPSTIRLHVSAVVVILEVLVLYYSMILLDHADTVTQGNQQVRYRLQSLICHIDFFVAFNDLKCVFANKLIMFRMLREISRHYMAVHNFNHWGRVLHICVGNLTTIGSDNGLLPGRREAIVWTNAGILSIGSLGTNFSGYFIDMHRMSFKKMHLTISFAKWQPFCLGLNVLKPTSLSTPHSSCWRNKTRQTCHNRP